MPRTSPWLEDPVELDPGAPVLVNSSKLTPLGSPPATRAAAQHPVGSRSSDLAWTHEIRSNLPLRPRPLDLDPTDLICPYRFGLAYLLKSPPGSEYSTRSPPPLKNNCS